MEREPDDEGEDGAEMEDDDPAEDDGLREPSLGSVGEARHMTVVRVKGFQIFNDRHGRWRCYHRATGTKIDLKLAPLGSAEFFAECARITALATVTTPKPGTLGLLIAAYRGHAAFLDPAPRTRADYQAAFDYLKPIADTPLIKFDKPLIVRIRDKAAKDNGRKFANDVKARFSGLFGWGSERGYLAANTAAGIKDIRRRKDQPDANGHGATKNATPPLPRRRLISGLRSP
jgi:hypothetical protein